jgi:hypothetical protein
MLDFWTDNWQNSVVELLIWMHLEPESMSPCKTYLSLISAAF